MNGLCALRVETLASCRLARRQPLTWRGTSPPQNGFKTAGRESQTLTGTSGFSLNGGDGHVLHDSNGFSGLFLARDRFANSRTKSHRTHFGGINGGLLTTLDGAGFGRRSLRVSLRWTRARGNARQTGINV